MPPTESEPSFAQSDCVLTLHYARPKRAASSLRPALLIAVAVILSLMAIFIFLESIHDKDPFAPSSDQAFVYLGMASAIIISWIAWAAFSISSLVRGKLKPAWLFALSPVLIWAALVTIFLYQNAATYIDQTTRIRGASWPILERIFRK